MINWKNRNLFQFTKNARPENDREDSDSIKKRQRMYYSNLEGYPQYRRINEKKSQHGKLSYAQIKGSLKFESMMSKRKRITS